MTLAARSDSICTGLDAATSGMFSRGRPPAIASRAWPRASVVAVWVSGEGVGMSEPGLQRIAFLLLLALALYVGVAGGG
ncbi:MAG: hypothetical protein WBO29_07290 [Albidovulum sp.]